MKTRELVEMALAHAMGQQAQWASVVRQIKVNLREASRGPGEPTKIKAKRPMSKKRRKEIGNQIRRYWAKRRKQEKDDI